MAKLDLERSRTIIDACFAKGRELGLQPLTVAVLDAGGNQVAMMRGDGSSLMRPAIAVGKAYGALAMGRGTRFLAGMARERAFFVNALNGVAGGALVPVPGGVLALDEAGGIVGAVGVTGDTSDQDEACAVAGIEAAGFLARPD